MITVPKSNVVPLGQRPPAPIYLAMAAAVMHEHGRLFEPPQPETKPTDGK